MSRIDEIRAQCEAWGKEESQHNDCGSCKGLRLALVEIPYLLAEIDRLKVERDQALDAHKANVRRELSEVIDRILELYPYDSICVFSADQSVYCIDGKPYTLADIAFLKELIERWNRRVK